jgi:hypothetical protein
MMLLGSVPVSLLGFEAGDPVDLFLLAHPKPTSGNIADFLRTYPEDRGDAAQHLLARGVDPKAVSAALSWLEAGERMKTNWPKIGGMLALASGAASAYHGYRRNDSIGWAAWWFLMGTVFPIFTPVVAVAQGFGKKKG